MHAAWHEGEGARFKLGRIKNANHTHNAEPYKKRSLNPTLFNLRTFLDT